MNRIILNETSYFGAGCRSVIAVEAARRGFKKAFFVTDKDLIKFGVAAEIIKVFDENQIPYELYSDVKANPTIANVQNGVAAYKASGADFIVALGGGSSIDTAKGIGIVVNNPDFADVKSLEGVADTKHKAVPTFALPTTAGTAAEVTINYVIIDEDARKKMVCVDPNDIPAVAIVDPELMYSMPKGLTAATGMDALTHAIESYITPGAWVMSDMFELNAESPAAPKYIHIAKAMGVDTTGMSEAEGVKAAVEAVKALSASINIPQKLHEINVKEEDIPALAVAAFNDVCTGGNPRPTSVADIEALYRKAF